MDRNEFVSTLRGILTGEVPSSVVEENVRYYDSYISQEIANGKSEREVLENLGDPRLIARTILDMQENPIVEEEYDTEMIRKGFRWDTWYGKLLILAIVVLVLALIISIVGGILSVVLPVVIPVLVIVWVIKKFTKN